MLTSNNNSIMLNGPMIAGDLPTDAKCPGNGYSHRIVQIIEYLKSAGFDYESIPENNASRARFKGIMQGWDVAKRAKCNVGKSLKRLSRLGRCTVPHREIISKYPTIKAFLWQSTAVPFTPIAGRAFGIPVIALPHNIESLVAGSKDPFTDLTYPESFFYEIEQLGWADSVFCISREEQWAMRGFRIQAEWLPYYPPSALHPNLRMVRERRKTTNAKYDLLLGFAKYKPTADGMRAILDSLSAAGFPSPIPLCVAGYGTELFLQNYPEKHVKVMGSLSDEALVEVMSGARSLIIHQDFGGGALTRIPEALLAGLPVICSQLAARSAFEFNGVHVYANFDGLIDLLRSDFQLIPLAPIRPVVQERIFLDTIRKLITKNTSSTGA